MTTETLARTATVGVAALGIGVADLARAARFYEEAVGLVSQRTLKLPHMDEIILGAEGGRGASVVLMHWTDGSARQYRDNPVKLVFSVPDAQAVVDRARAAGHEVVREPEASAAMGGMLIAFVKDADGYLVELLQKPARPAA